MGAAGAKGERGELKASAKGCLGHHPGACGATEQKVGSLNKKGETVKSCNLVSEQMKIHTTKMSAPPRPWPRVNSEFTSKLESQVVLI